MVTLCLCGLMELISPDSSPHWRTLEPVLHVGFRTWTIRTTPEAARVSQCAMRLRQPLLASCLACEDAYDSWTPGFGRRALCVPYPGFFHPVPASTRAGSHIWEPREAQWEDVGVKMSLSPEYGSRLCGSGTLPSVAATFGHRRRREKHQASRLRRWPPASDRTSLQPCIPRRGHTSPPAAIEERPSLSVGVWDAHIAVSVSG